MNVVVGNSIKIETQLNIGVEQFRKHWFNPKQWPVFLFTSSSTPAATHPFMFDVFEHVGRNRMIIEDVEMLVDTLIVSGSSVVTELHIVIDVFSDCMDVNDIVNNIIDNSDSSCLNHTAP